MKNLKKHPIFYAPQELADICKPLKQLNITYFAQARIDNANNLMVLSNGPAFFEHYLNQQYYNADLHTVGMQLGEYVIWDSVERRGKSDKMHTEAAQFGIQHTFTIIQKNENGCDFFHFANNSPYKSINQVYLANLDLLKMFIVHFKEKVSQSKILTSAYDYKFKIATNAEGYNIKNAENFKLSAEMQKTFARDLSIANKLRYQLAFDRQTHHHQSIIEKLGISNREQEIVYHLIKGKTAKIIAQDLKISNRTVEQHLINIKNKINVSTKSELIQKILAE